MKLSRKGQMPSVHVFTDQMRMIFRPSSNNISIQNKSKRGSFIDTLSTYIFRNKSITSDGEIDDTKNHSEIIQRPTQYKPGTFLKYLLKVTSEIFIIGNENQLDIINLGGVVGQWVDTEYLCSLNIGKAILKVTIDPKKFYLAIYTQNLISLFKLNLKRPKQTPKLINTLYLSEQLLFLQFPKESFLCLFMKKYVQVYVINDNTTFEKKLHYQYKVASNLNLFQVPPARDNSINIFFQGDNISTSTFALWSIQMHFKSTEILISEIHKIYDIKKSLKLVIKLQNYEHQIFLMNLGYQILVVKKGYVIDSAQVNIQQKGSFLLYLGKQKILHITRKKIQIYNFHIDFSVKPHRIVLKSLDSIELQSPEGYEYVGALEMFGGNFVIFFQINPSKNKKIVGEISYALAITQKISIENKISQIFPFTCAELRDPKNLTAIEEKCDMAKKIGLTQRQIYLYLWSKTKKQTVEDFQFLLDTMDYETIRKQIENKLKITSMNLKIVYKIQQGCFNMLQKYLLSANHCTEDIVQNYICSHFLLRQLELFRDISVNQKTKSGYKASNQNNHKQMNGKMQKKHEYMINIQQYHQYLRAQIKSFFLQFISEFCSQDKDVISDIRIFLRAFKFPFRIVYKQILAEIITLTKTKLIKILKAFPELLPYEHINSQQLEDSTLYEGIWGSITSNDWQNNLHIENITTIYNKDVIDRVINSLWFRRNMFTQHDLIAKSRHQILQIDKQNKSEHIFYFFIARVFEELQDKNTKIQVMEYLQETYKQLPQHLNGRIFLYHRLFQYFKAQDSTVNVGVSEVLHQFLKLQDYQLFKEFFKYEKIRKGCILKQIKSIYEQIPNGIDIFNESLQHYFASDESQISDLKYIMNRMNNEKRQFHAANEKMYQVLVKGMQMKIKLGSENDIPIDQVMIYFENIPFPKDSNIMNQLQTVQKINQQAQRFSKMKLNMTILQILENCQNVITAMVNYEIQSKKVLLIRNEEEIKQVTYNILAQLQTVKQKLYQNQYSDLSFFIYLSKIMEEIEMVPYAAVLLEDEYLLRYFSVDIRIIQNLVLFMYKWKFSRDICYIRNEKYIREILQLLPNQSQFRVFIEHELQFAIKLSTDANPLQYPLTDTSSVLSILDLQSILSDLPCEFICSLDVKRIYQIMHKMQELCFEDNEEIQLTSFLEVYEVVFMQMIENNMVKQAIKKIQQILQYDQSEFIIVYPLIVILQLLGQLNQENKTNFLRLISLLFYEPKKLVEIIKRLVNGTFSSSEERMFFINELKLVEQDHKIFDQKNNILDRDYLYIVEHQDMQENFESMLAQTNLHLLNTKQQFQKNVQYPIVFIILSHMPYVLAKYIYCKRYSINLKVLRSYLSYVIKEDIFDSLKVLQFGRRLFYSLLQSLKMVISIDTIISQYYTTDLNQQVQINIDNEEDMSPQNLLQQKFYKSVIAFNRKKISVGQDLLRKSAQYNIEERRNKIKLQLKNPNDLSQKAPSQYPFPDSDDDFEQKSPRKIVVEKKTKNINFFDPNVERNLIMGRKDKNVTEFFIESVDLSKSMKKPKLKNISGYSASVRYNNSRTLKLRDQLQPIRLTSSNIQKQLAICHADSEQIDNSRSGADDDNKIQLLSQFEGRIISHTNSYQAEDINEEKKQAKFQQCQINSNFNNQSSPSHLFQVVINEVDDDSFPLMPNMCQDLFQGTDTNENQIIFNLSGLSLLSERKGFINYLMQLLKYIYMQQQRPLKVILTLIKQIYILYPELDITRQYLQIYFKLQSMHSKYSLKVPIRQILPFQGLILRQKDPQYLFDYIYPKLVSFVDENNIVTMSSIINISFKPSTLGQRLIYSFLCKAFEKYNMENHTDQTQTSRQKEKMKKLLEKLSESSLKDLYEQMRQKLPEESSKIQVLNLIEETTKNKFGN